MATAVATRTIGTLNIDQVTRAPRRLSKSVRLEAGQKKVFDFIRQHENWTRWFPILKAVSVDNSQAQSAGGNNCIRHCTLVNGVQFSEKIVGYDPPNQFGYAIEDDNPLGVQGHLAVVTVEAEAGGGSILRWHQYFDHPQAETFVQEVNQILDGGIQSLLERFGGESLETVFHE